MAAAQIRQLVPGDAAAFQTLRLHALRECPEAFGSTFAEEEILSLDVIAERLTPARRPVGRATFGAFVNETLVGITGCVQEAKTKARHKAIVWGMYVVPEQRGRGIARRLLEAIILEARSWPDVERLTLTVVERAAAARQLYRAMGFQPFGRELDGLRQEGVGDTVEYMSLSLRDASR
ncbi:MAG TPA: GNAT family N-acetyltransferase [Gemmatimonadaceae bacterium]|nr:GNAT family N-acetyltransferase [Gemmatimonadaceae bacterium]